MEEDNLNIISKEEEKDLKEELQNLVSTERKKVIEELKIARSFGDLRENAEYDSAREKQAVIENRIIEIEDILKNSKVVETRKSNNAVVVGSIVDVQVVGEGNKTFTIGKQGKGIEVSLHSPVAKALLGNGAGDTIRVQTPKSEKKFTILKIH